MKRASLVHVLLPLLLLAAAAPAFAATASKQAVGEQRILVVLAKFPDVAPSLSPEALQGKYFTRLDRYLRAVSGGKAWVTGKTAGWYTLPENVAAYRISAHNLSVDKHRVSRLIQDSLDLADADEDLSKYSMVFISLGAKRTDYGMVGLCGYPGMLGWQAESPIKTQKRGQSVPGGVAIFCEEAHVGVVFHDMAHILGGVEGRKRVMPCLYDHDLQGQRGTFRGQYQFYLTHLGYFDPMSCHLVKFDQPPPGLCAWTKLRLNWVDPQSIVEVRKGTSRTLLLGPLSRPGPGVRVVRIPIDATTYYLVENRQPIGPDASLPSHGVLISYCDDTIAECRQGRTPVKLVDANPSVPELRGAPFSPSGRSSFADEKRGISVSVTRQKGDEYELTVSNGK